MWHRALCPPDQFTPTDMKAIKRAGLTHIRIPVGYWLFGDIRDGEPWVAGGVDHLYAALDWASQQGLKVVLDVHCGPGSQNGFDNSGKKGALHWNDFAYRADGSKYYPNIDRTVDFLGTLSDHFASKIWALEILNEPFITIDEGVLKVQSPPLPISRRPPAHAI